LILGFDGFLRRIHFLEETGDRWTAHPLLDTSQACSTSTQPIDLRNYHTYVTCLHFCEETNTLVIGGGNEGSQTPSISLWELSDRSPYCKYLDGTMQPGEAKNRGYFYILYSAFKNTLQTQPNMTSLLYKVTKGTTNLNLEILFNSNGSKIAGWDISGNVTVWSLNPLLKIVDFHSGIMSLNKFKLKPISMFLGGTISLLYW
jgi:hypothetical protein